MGDTETLQGLTERIGAAPFAPQSWASVLEDVATIAGGWGGQLIAAEGGQFRFFLGGSEVTPDMVGEFAARGGGDVNCNPRYAAVLKKPTMTAFSDVEAIDESVRKRSPLYQEFLRPVGSPYASLAMLEQRNDLVVVTAINHSERQGAPGAEALAKYQVLLPHLKAAARMQMRLEDDAASIALGAMESLSIAAIICDYEGRVVATSTQADKLLSEGSLVCVRQSTLYAASPGSDRELRAAIDKAKALDSLFTPKASTVLLRSADGAHAKVADVAPLPSAAHQMRVGARVLVTIGGAAQRQKHHFLQELGLTDAEADVARALATGANTREIAERRGVAFETVRSQIKSIYAKLQVRRQSELFNRLRDLL